MTPLRMIGRYLGGRAQRREFWAWVVVLVAAAIGYLFTPLAMRSLDPLYWSLLACWCVIAVRRLRDAGLPVWLAPFPLVAVWIALGLHRLVIEADLVRSRALRDDISRYVTLAAIVLIAIVGVWPRKAAPPASPQEQAEVFG